ncbi:MAG: glycoside hydrolase family 10 protein [Phycisphaerales bacterium]
MTRLSKEAAAALVVVIVCVLALGVGVWRAMSKATIPSPDLPPLARTTEAVARPVPEIPRSLFEFRGLWVATVDNIDWPSRKGLPAREQRQEMMRIIGVAESLNLNAIVLQVRPSCDAIYPSALEPWSEYLSGTQGVPRDDRSDPLAEWIAACHARGIELHAWFNPFRARHFKATSPNAASHVSNVHPRLVKTYGTRPDNTYQWLDPGDPAARQHTLDVVLDVVTRYDIDAVHMDDYFYPYPIDKLEFPDEASYATYRKSGGTLARDEWRRNNINTFVQTLAERVHAAKPGVRVGISPFGIWKPGHPKGVEGMDQTARIFADPKLWLNEGWVDYLAPQLYWTLDAPKQPYAPLLSWWIGENSKGRHVFVGNNASRVAPVGTSGSWRTDEILNQVAETRRQNAAGNILYSAIALVEDRDSLATKLRAGPYATPALAPQATWLARPPVQPRLTVKLTGASPLISWAPGDTTPVRRWVLLVERNGQWELSVKPPTVSFASDYDLFPLVAGAPGTRPAPATPPTRLAVIQVGPAGVLGPPAVVDVPPRSNGRSQVSPASAP